MTKPVRRRAAKAVMLPVERWANAIGGRYTWIDTNGYRTKSEASALLALGESLVRVRIVPVSTTHRSKGRK